MVRHHETFLSEGCFSTAGRPPRPAGVLVAAAAVLHSLLTLVIIKVEAAGPLEQLAHRPDEGTIHIRRPQNFTYSEIFPLSEINFEQPPPPQTMNGLHM